MYDVTSVSADCRSLWQKTTPAANCLASPLSSRPCVQPAAGSSFWRWDSEQKKQRISSRFLLMGACFRNKYKQPCEKLTCSLPRRASTSGITTWSRCGRATTANSRTPTWFRATTPTASPGRFSGRRILSQWVQTFPRWQLALVSFAQFSPDLRHSGLKSKSLLPK